MPEHRALYTGDAAFNSCSADQANHSLGIHRGFLHGMEGGGALPMFSNPGAFFLGTLVPSEQKFIKAVLESARVNGYNKVVEPCAGAFAMSHLAVQTGFAPQQIEASDVSMFTSIMGYAITGQSLEALELHADGFTDEELLNPAMALYAWKYLSMIKDAEKEYFYAHLIDMERRRDEHIAVLQQQLDRAKSILHGMSYRALDMWEHLEEVIDDPHALVIANPPTYTAGFEKYYDTCGRMTWKEPQYGIFDPETGLQELMDKVRDAKCLLLCYEENKPGETTGAPVFARYGVRNGINVYLTTNRPDEVVELSHGKHIARPLESKIEGLNCSVLPTDYEFSEHTRVEVRKIEQRNAQYYRKLWTHNFIGASSPMNFAVFVDGMIAGVFGMDKSALIMGAFGTQVSDSVFLMYGMTIPHRTHRIGRLLTMIAQNKPFVMDICSDLEKEKAKTLKTVQMTKYPEAKEMRGVMKLAARNKDPKKGYRLTYVSELKDRTIKQTYAEWLGKEKKWRKARTENMGKK